MLSADKAGMQRRMRRSREEWSSLVSRFEESGQTREAFCAAVDLGLHRGMFIQITLVGKSHQHG
mgnify:CR=1 FL=1